MRIATWNVNSLKARLSKVTWWLERAAPDVLLLQETKLHDGDVPRETFSNLGYEIAHHGEGRWNGVAVVSKVGLEDVIANFGEPTVENAGDGHPLSEARMISAVCAGVRVVSLYAPNGRAVASPFFAAKLAWFARLSQWLEETRSKDEALVLGGDYNVAPDDRDVWDAKTCHGGTHVSPEERAAVAKLASFGLVDAYRKHHEEAERYTWWDYRAGDFYKNFGMRIDHLFVSQSVADRTVDSEIDREARKGKPTPSDHAPLIVDLDQAGKPFDPGWVGASERIAARRIKKGGKT
jgi:exodeoxyribonuclease-3